MSSPSSPLAELQLRLAFVRLWTACAWASFNIAVFQEQHPEDYCRLQDSEEVLLITMALDEV